MRVSAPTSGRSAGAENAYGVLKRLNFVSEVAQRLQPRSVIDVGCGSGAYLTAPLARRFPDAQVLGVDTDEDTIRHATLINASPNVRYACVRDVGALGSFDLVVASEVLEHVDEPHRLMRGLREIVQPRGRVVLTVPNGCGPFELASTVRDVLIVTGLHAVLRRAARVLRLWRSRPYGSAFAYPAPADTLAESPHLWYFSLAELRQLVRQSGFRIVRVRPRTWLCGFGLDMLVRGPLIPLNAHIADVLPMWCASDWMLELEPMSPHGEARPSPRARGGSPSRYRALRRWLAQRVQER